MEPGSLSGCVTRPHLARPPLREAVDRRIVNRHFGFEAENPPSPLPEAEAQLRLLASDERREEAADLAQGIDAQHCVAAAAIDESRGCLPFEVAKPVVDRPTRIALAQAPADHGDLRVGDEGAASRLEPTID